MKKWGLRKKRLTLTLGASVSTATSSVSFSSEFIETAAIEAARDRLLRFGAGRRRSDGTTPPSAPSIIYWGHAVSAGQ
jgi:hypothetical protein